MSLLLDAAYLAGLTLASPYFLYKALTSEKYRTGLRQRLGGVPERAGSAPCIWLHAVSVGEMALSRPLVAALRQRWPRHQIVLSTATNTGRDAAAKLLAALPEAPEDSPPPLVVYFPLDFSWAVRKALRRLRPDLVLLVELELWPNFLEAAARAGVPVAVVNGRVSDRSFPRYRRLRPLVRRWLRRVALCCAQNETCARRLRQLGAPPERVVVTGNLKFDAALPAPDAQRPPMDPASLGLRPDEPLLVGGCTWPGEDEALLTVYRGLRREVPRLRLLLAPRQADRFPTVERLVRETGLPCLRRTALQAAGTSPGQAEGRENGGEAPVILLDTVGELAAVYALATVVFVGGSLHPRGGQNIIEPSALAKPVLFGPHTDNFRDVTDELLTHDAALCVRDEAELGAACRRLLEDPAAAAALGARALQLVERHRGASRRTLDALAPLLPSSRQKGTQAT